MTKLGMPQIRVCEIYEQNKIIPQNSARDNICQEKGKYKDF